MQISECTTILKISDVQIKPGGDTFVLKLRTFKTDPFSNDVELLSFENDHFEPVCTMISYLDPANLCFVQALTNPH